MRALIRLACTNPHLVVALAAASASAAVGPNDRCPWPTPYPPAGAGWGVAKNADFEGGFTANAANQWVAWKDPQWSTQVFYAGDDRKFNGGYSQKLILPRPTVDMQEAGLYQQIYVVPGATYTVSVRVYLAMPGTTSGEHLLSFLGVSPYGDNSGKGGSSFVWDEESRLNEWREASVTVQAVFPVMTITLKGTRKWPIGGNDATVWFDAVTITGPIPTTPPPGPEPDPVDPETLIPQAAGPNVVANPSFEEAFTGGVSAGWNKWSRIGTGTWKQSQRIGKVGGAQYDCGGSDELAIMKPKTILLLGPNPETNYGTNLATLGTANYLNSFDHMQDTIIVGRPFVDNNYGNYYSNPAYYGPRLADQCKVLESKVPRIDCWQALNEPDWSFNWQSVVRFEYEFALRCHQLGLKTCSLNLATGNPGDIWRMVDTRFNPSAGDLLGVADYLGHHVYGGPADGFMVTNQVKEDACSFALRPRRFKDMYDRRGWRFAPVIATEGSTWFPWHGRATPDRVMTDLLAMGNYMNVDRWWCGYTNFVVGAQCSWPDFDIVGQYLANGKSMAQAIGEWNAANPADAMQGLYSQMFGAGKVHPKTLAELTPAGQFDGGINRQITGLIPGREHLFICWMKYEFRGKQPTQLKFYLGVDPTGQTGDPNAATIDWGTDQIASKAPIHEIFSHVWRTFTPPAAAASIWLRAHNPVADPSFMVYLDQVEVKAMPAPPGPTIGLSATAIEVSGIPGINPAPRTFTVRNTGADTLNYSLSDNATWLSVAPTQGSSAGEADEITITFDAAGLPAGTHQATITVDSANAINAPQALTVTLTLAYPIIRADYDRDGDVDQSDFGVFQNCLTGSGFAQLNPACADARLDADEDVDQDDFAIFQRCMSGAGILANPQCESN